MSHVRCEAEEAIVRPLVVVDPIPALARRHLSLREARLPFPEIKARSRDAAPARDAVAALLRDGCGVIPELRGLACSAAGKGYDPQRAARAYEEEGAHLIACRAEPQRFLGALAAMVQARAVVSVPVMACGLFFDPYQIHEVRVFGADLVSLRVHYLDQYRLAALADRAESLGMTALAEVRTPEEAGRALDAGLRVLGINTRDRATGTANAELFAEITTGLPESTICVGMAGVKDPSDLLAYAANGADAVVVGSAVRCSFDPSASLRALTAAGQHPACAARRSR
ncbi:indole-3-glycerol-phosphate synthase TrpC [Corynebacterium sp. zg-331]|uniref:indole-3-glycerol-phosphate synthase TrpC n=1 Tax=unclassified Corynebacterium TaxID=2624378 RepID=UPI00128DCA95|nr:MULTISPECIES: indole-3-glycerol-phosphate synthase TrpC [unclassified Corynebacterium]MBC3185273.1 indole-3-glycerol-phosphate synthase TrpC [Corynebacterium sp. zg-331]MPV51770.1 indole-3-glycerol-phosphate synthase TrpC [Corynebacterium sp. zg331]